MDSPSLVLSRIMGGKDVDPQFPPTPAETPCTKKTAENGSFVRKLKDHFHEFIHTPMDEHKACFKQTMHKIIDKVREKASPSPKGGEKPVAPLQTAPKK